MSLNNNFSYKSLKKKFVAHGIEVFVAQSYNKNLKF